MTTKEELFKELCLEVAAKGIHTDRFTELWLATGINLDSWEFEIANKMLVNCEDEESFSKSRH